MTEGPPGSREIDVCAGREIPDCPRCGQPALMMASVPHGWDNAGAPPTRGTIPVVLCTSCDADDPDAGPLITFFHVHGKVTPDLVREAADLIRRWAESITIPAADPAAIDREAEAWRNGQL